MKRQNIIDRIFRRYLEIPDLWYNGIALKPNTTVVEIGALSGNISLHAQKAFGVTNLYAVEALPSNYQMLVDNCRNSSVKPINVAVGNHNGEVCFYQYDRNSSSSLFRIGHDNKYRRNVNLRQIVRVRSVTLQTLMEEQGIQKIDLLLMNCEGAESLILPQIIHCPTLVKKIRQISIELHPMIFGQRKVLEMIRMMYFLYDYRVITRTLRGPINVVFTCRGKRKNGVPPRYALQAAYARGMDILWPVLTWAQKMKHRFFARENSMESEPPGTF